MNTRFTRPAYAAVLVLVLGAAVAAGILTHGPILMQCRSLSAVAGTAGSAQFLDTKQNTRLLLQTPPSKDAGQFSYETGAGVSYHGGPVNGLSTRAGGTGIGTADALACAGFLRVTFDGGATRSEASQDQTQATSTKVTVHLVALIDLSRLTASVAFDDLTNKHSYSTNTTAPTDLGGVVRATEQAATKQDWPALYALTAQSTLGSLTEAQFAQAMADQVQAVGAVTAMTMTSTPKVVTDPTGVTYFTVTEHITMTHGGTPTTFDVLAVYVLEGGTWKLWFTKDM